MAEGANGTTSAQFSNLPPDSTYFWHARAKIDGTDGVFSPPGTFRVNTPVVFDKPQALTPGAEQDAFGPRPSFTVSNPPRSGPVTAVVYEFQIASNSTFSPVLTQGTVPEGRNGQTSFQPSIDLPEGSLVLARAPDRSGQQLTGSLHRHGAFQPEAGSRPRTRRLPEGAERRELAADLDDHQRLSLQAVTSALSTRSSDSGRPQRFFETPGALEGNQWVLANIGGTWYAGAADWYRPGQGCKGVNNNIGVDSFDKQPLHGWHPQPGETIGVMSTTPARLYPAMKTIDQRTNVVFIKW